jgi:adenylate kinase
MSYKEIDIHPQEEKLSQLLVVVGVPAAGKDFILKKAREYDPLLDNRVRILDFGEILFQNLKKSYHLETKDEIARKLTQIQIVEAVDELTRNLKKPTPSILNTHLVYKQNNLLQINIDTIRKLDIKGLLYVWADPEVIFMRRKNDLTRTRLIESVDEISFQQEVEQSVAEIFSHQFGSFMRNINNEATNVNQNIQILFDQIKSIQK